MAKQPASDKPQAPGEPGAANSTSSAPGGKSGDASGAGSEPKLRAKSSSQENPKSQPDAIALLKSDHRNVEMLFDEYEKASSDKKDELINEICLALSVHTILEEEIFYPACRQDLGSAPADEQASVKSPTKSDERDQLNEAQVEHDSAKVLITDLERSHGDDRFRDAKVKVLSEQIKHHVAEEEKPRTGIFAKAEKDGVNTPELGQRVQQRKAELEAGNNFPPVRPVSFTAPMRRSQSAMESTMTSNRMRERNHGGRLQDDQHRGQRGQNEDGRSSRDRSHGGWFGEHESEYGQRRGSMRYSGGSGNYENRGGSAGSRGQGGWFGNQDGDSAHRQGPSRYASGGRDDQHQHRGGWDSRNDDSRGPFGRDQGGSHEGGERRWEGAGSSRYASSRGDDDQRGRSFGDGGRSPDRDERRSSGGFSGVSGSQRGGARNGGGGWFANNRGHSEAERRQLEGRHRDDDR